MTTELHWLELTLALTAVLYLPYVLNRVAVRGVIGTMANPSADDAPLAAWAQRARQAHANAVENLAVFAPAVLAVEVLHRGSPLTAFAGGVYFYARAAHFVVYAAGIPVLRTLAFLASWAAIVAFVATGLGWL